MAGTLQPSTGGSPIRERPATGASRRRFPPITTWLSHLGGRPPIRQSRGDRVFNGFNRLFLWGWLVVVLYPLVYVLSSSFSSPLAVITGRVWLLPVEPVLDGYKAVFQSKMVWTGYYNSIFYAVFGTAINVVITIMAAYPLARRDFVGRNAIMFLFTFTLFFSGGLIPTYLLVRDLGLVNTRWAMLLPGALGVWHVIITRTYFQSTLPQELLESAHLDGCSNLRFIWSIVLPLSKAIVAVIALFYAVNHWNTFFSALIYLKDQELFPLPIVLRTILIQNQVDATMMDAIEDLEQMAAREHMEALLKYALIVVASVPVLMIYPFVQRYFVKGVMIGALKG